MRMIRIIFNGIGGRIGRTMYKHLINNTEFVLVAGVDMQDISSEFSIPVYNDIFKVKEEADVILDFSVISALENVVKFAHERNLKLVVATTGLTEEHLQLLKKASEDIAVFRSSNMSLGVNILTALAKETAGFLGTDYDIEIIEQHHNLKYDSPSGTALTIAEAINSVRDNSYEFVYGRHATHQRRAPNEIGIHAVRGGSIVGKHDIMYIGAGEVITLSHESQNKEVFVSGSLRAAAYLMDKPFGLFDMNSIIGSIYAVTTVTVESGITLINIPHISTPQFIALLEKLGNKNVNLDMISQTLNDDDTLSVSFTLPDSASEIAFAELYQLNSTYITKENTSKITSEGAGMAHQCGVAKDVFKILNSVGANIFSITTSETKISCCIDSKSSEAAVAALKKYYRL